MGEVEDGVFVAGRNVDQNVALVELGLQEADVLPAEDEGDPLSVSAGALGELPRRDGDAGVVALALGDDAARSGHEKAAFDGLPHGGDDVRPFEDEVPVLGAVPRLVVDLAGVDQPEVVDIEVRHASADGADVPGELRAHDHYADVRHVIRPFHRSVVYQTLSAGRAAPGPRRLRARPIGRPVRARGVSRMAAGRTGPRGRHPGEGRRRE